MRRHEHSKLTSVGRASRLEILRRYLVTYKAGAKARIVKDREQRKRRHANAAAEAVKERPELVQHVRAPGGGRGHLRMHTANFQEYLREHRVRLQEAAKKTRGSAAAGPQAKKLPQCNAEWMDWLSNHSTEFAEVMRQAGPEARKALNTRLVLVGSLFNSSRTKRGIHKRGLHEKANFP